MLLFVNLYHVLSTLIGNADILLLPNLYRDIASGSFQWFCWCLPPARNIFPDLAVFSLLRSFIPGDMLALFIQVLLYVLLLGLLIAYLAHKLSGISYARSLLPVFLAMALFTLPGVFAPGAIYGLVMPTWHGGAVPLTLLAWIIWLSCMESPGPWKLPGLAVISCVLGFSDPLCFMTFVYPAALAIFFSKYIWVFKVGFVLLVVCPALLGNWFGDLLVLISPIQYAHQGGIDVPSILASCGRFFMDFADGRVMLCWLTFLIGLMTVLWCWKVTWMNAYKWVGLILVLFMPVMGTLLVGRYGDSANFRYFPLTFLLPLVALVWLAWRKYSRPLSAAVAIIAALTVCACLRYLPSWAEMTSLRDAELIESCAGDMRLKCGLANYFLSGVLRYHSHGSLMVNDLDVRGFLNMKLCSLAWLGLPYTPPPAREYNFILTRDLDRRMLLLIYGPPSRVYTIFLEKQGCQLWLYNRDLAESMAIQPQLLALWGQRLEKSGYLLNLSGIYSPQLAALKEKGNMRGWEASTYTRRIM